jgi:putative SOS response-associated peptidase YedK
MCSNFRPPDDHTRLRLHFAASIGDGAVWPPEAWPLYQAPIIRRADSVEHSREALLGQYGMLPHWGKDANFARHTYNARSETAAEKPSFRDAWRKGHRCVIPADWIYEPSYASGKAVRWKIARTDGAPMGIAGLWSTWLAPSGAEVMSFTMLTINADAHPLMRQFHKPDDEKRMVVTLDEADYDAWLDCPPNRMMAMMQPYPADLLTAEPAPLVRRKA